MARKKKGKKGKKSTTAESGGGKGALTFFDVKAKKKFSTSNYRLVNKGGTTFAVAKSPHSGIEAWRVVKRGKRRGAG